MLNVLSRELYIISKYQSQKCDAKFNFIRNVTELIRNVHKVQ